MRSSVVSRVLTSWLGVSCLLTSACVGAPENDEPLASLSTEEQELIKGGGIIVNAPTTAITTCVDRQICTVECTPPKDIDSLYECKFVCKTVCVPL